MNWQKQIHELKDQIENIRLFEKNVMLNLHWSLDDAENADYFRLQEVLAARDEEERPVDPLAMVNHLRNDPFAKSNERRLSK